MFKNIFSQIAIKKREKKVLVVEDDSLLARVIEEELNSEGIKSAIVSNGLDVASAVEKFKPDFILLDLVLPRLIVRGQALIHKTKM